MFILRENDEFKKYEVTYDEKKLKEIFKKMDYDCKYAGKYSHHPLYYIIEKLLSKKLGNYEAYSLDILNYEIENIVIDEAEFIKREGETKDFVSKKKILDEYFYLKNKKEVEEKAKNYLQELRNNIKVDLVDTLTVDEYLKATCFFEHHHYNDTWAEEETKEYQKTIELKSKNNKKENRK